jgi:serine/threonine protein kinase
MAEDRDRAGEVVGDYQLLERMDRGGAGGLYRAERRGTDRLVALRLLDPERTRDPIQRDRFLLEACLATRLSHPNVATLHAGGQDLSTGAFYLSTEFVSGGNLYQRVEASGPLDTDEALELGLALARALAAASLEGVLHTAISPSNILYAPAQGETAACWKLAGFGLANGFGDAARTQQLSQTLWPTTPPEIWAAEAFDGRADVYSLGRTLYYALCGEWGYPAQPEGESAWRRAHLRQPSEDSLANELVPLHELRADLPAALSQLVHELIGVDPESRPASAVEVGRRLEEVAALERLAAGPPDLPPAPAPPVRKRRWPRLLHREVELGQLSEAVHACLDRRGSCLVFSGPGGIGCSRLLDEAADLVAEGGLRVLRATCTGQPMGLPQDLLRELLGGEQGLTPAAIGERLGALAGQEGIVLACDVVRRLLGSGDLPPQGELSLHPTVLAGLFASAAERGPLALLVDELHRADPASAEFLVALAQVSEDVPLLVLAGTRDSIPQEVLEKLCARTPTRWCPVSRLGSKDMRRLARASLGHCAPPLPPPAVEASIQRAQGLPAVPIRVTQRALASGALSLNAGAVDVRIDELQALGRELLTELQSELHAEARGSASSLPGGGFFELPTLDSEVEPAPIEAASRSADLDEEVSLSVDEACSLRSANAVQPALRSLHAAWGQWQAGRISERVAWRVGVELAHTHRLLAHELESAHSVAREARRIANACQAARGSLRAFCEELWLQLLSGQAVRAGEQLHELEDGPLTACMAHVAQSADPCDQRALASLEIAWGATHSRLSRFVQGVDDTRAEHAEAATQHLDRARQLAAQTGAVDLYAIVFQVQGDHVLHLGADLKEARRLIEESLRLKKQLGDLAGMARSYGSLARIATLSDPPRRAEAIAAYEEDLKLALQLDDHRGVGVVSNGLGELYEELYAEEPSQLRLQKAEEAFQRAGVAALRTGNRVDEAISGFYYGRFLSRTRGEHAWALRELEQALARLEAIGNARMIQATQEVLTSVREAAARESQAEEGSKKRIGHYEILGKLGQGGMGVVYRARDTRSGALVALKVLRRADAEQSQSEVERFQLEAQAAQRLRHPNLVGLVEHGQAEDGRWYMALDLVEGESLSQLLARDGPLPPGEAVWLTGCLADALAYAHEQGVLHRDVKPHNVMMATDGTPLLTDFGLAMLQDEGDPRLTHTGALLGTPAYMAPEQVHGVRAAQGWPTDVYALGAALHEMLTGAPPFVADSLAGLLLRIVDDSPPAIRVPQVNRALQALIHKCLAKSPSDRFATAGLMARALDAWLQNHERTIPPGAFARAKHWLSHRFSR